jgi:tetratricopeptide (TPR) repeat protein
LSINNDETIRKIIIYTIIPYSFPFTEKWITLFTKEDKIPVHVYLKTVRRFDILNLFFSKLPSVTHFAFGNQLPTFDPSKFTWMPSDRFGQVNFMKATFNFDVTEKKLNDTKKEIKKIYLPLCVEGIKRISTGYRLITNTYFPRNFTINDIIAYRLGFILKNNNQYYEEKEAYPNVDFQDSYPDDKPTIDISDFLKYDGNIRLHTELMTNAEDFFTEDNYRMSVIEANTAVETLIFNILKKYYNTFPITCRNEVSFEQLSRMSIAKINKYLNIISPKITSSKQWNHWKSKCQELRHDIVHNQVTPKRNETKEALSSANALLELLKNFLYDENDWILEATAFIKDKEKAKSYLRKSIAVKPNADAYYYLGNIDFIVQKYDTARKYYEKALKYFNHPVFYYNIGNCDKEQKLYKDAIKHYDIAISLNFELRHPYINPYYQKLLILLEQNVEHTPNDIIQLLNVLIEAFPHNTEFQTLRAKFES